MFVPFAEATKSVVPVASDPKGIEIVKASMVRLSSGKQDDRLSPVWSKSTMVNVQNKVPVDQSVQSTEFPQMRGRARVVSGDLTSIGRSSNWQSPKVVSRSAEVDDLWQRRASGVESITARVQPLAKMH